MMHERLSTIDRRVADIGRRLSALPDGRLDDRDRAEIVAYGQMLATVRIMLIEADQVVTGQAGMITPDIEALATECSGVLDDIEPQMAIAEAAAVPKGRLAGLGAAAIRPGVARALPKEH